MKINFSKITTIFLIGLILAGVVFVHVRGVAGATLEELQQRIDKLNQQRKKLERQSQKYQKQISQKKGEIRSLETAIQSLRAQESRLRVDINLTENKLARTRNEIEKLKIKIQNKKKKIRESKRTLTELLRVYSRKEEVSTMEVIFSKDDISDLFDRAKDLSLIQENMQKRLVELKKTKEDLAQNKSEAEQKRKSLGQLKEQKQAQRTALEHTETQKANYLAQTRQEKNKYNQYLKQVQRRKRELLSRLKQLQRKAERRKNFQVFVDSGKKPKPGTKVFQWPESAARTTQGFGRTDFARNSSYYSAHYGMDMAAGAGTPIKAAAKGEVIASGSDIGPNGLWGNWVVISHKIGLVTLYAHMSAPSSVSEGEAVKTGQVIGYQGATGRVTGSHLHFGVYESFFTFLSGGTERPCYFPSDSCKPVDPQLYL